jgi:glutamate dehydrogenase (NAD(P)+)
MDDLATGHGVKAAAEAALAHGGRALTGAAIAIEGFGKVGAGMALASARAGARIVGISTVDGLLADPEGLDVEELFSLREKFGDGLVAHGPAPVRPREELFELECDVLVPGARPDSITRELAARLRCAVVAPGANAPYGPGAVDELHRRGIVAVPDFIANAGGIHLYTRVAEDDSPPEALARIEALIQEGVSRTLIGADEHGLTPLAAALRAGREFLAESGADDDLLDELFA